MDSSVDLVLKKDINQSINNIIRSDRSSSNPKTYQKNSEIDLCQNSQKQLLFKKIYQINTQNLKQRQSDNIILESRSQSSQNIDKSAIKNASVQIQQANRRSVKQIVIKKQITIESLNSSNDQLSPEVKVPQSARHFNRPTFNLCSLNNRIQQLEQTNSKSKLNQYFFPSQKPLSNRNENSQVYCTYFNQQNSNQSIDEKPAKKKIIIRRDALNTSRGIEMQKGVQQQNNYVQKEISSTDSISNFRRYDEDSDENFATSERNEKPKTESNIPFENENKFKGRNMYSFQTQIIKKVPKNTPIKLEEGQNIDKSYSIQEDISNLNLATTTCSSGNEELSPNYLPVDRKLMKIIKVNKNLCKYGKSNQVEESKSQTNILKNQINLVKNAYKQQNIQNFDQNGNLQLKAKQEQNSQQISQDQNQDHKKESTEEILANQLGIFEVTQTENILIKKLKILSQCEFNLYEAYQIKNLQQSEINSISSFISAMQNDSKGQMFTNVLNYKHFIQNQDSSLLIFPFQSNKTLKNLLQNIKLLNEQLLKIFFKDILCGLQQIYYNMKTNLINLLDFDQIFIDEKYKLFVGLNINQSKIDPDQIYLQYLSEDESNNQQQYEKINKLQFREECNIVQDFGFLILKSLLGPNYAIFEQNTNHSNQIRSLISDQNNYKKCCLFHDIKFISEKNITDSRVQLKKANEITKFISKNCSQQLQDILCGSLKYKKEERLNIFQLQQQYFFQSQLSAAIDNQQINNNNNQSQILKLLFQQVQIKEKQQDTLQSKTQKLQLLIRLKLVIANSKSLFDKIQPQTNYQKIQEKIESQLSQYLSITTQEIKNIINIEK
ncbi:hypothetical protein TTHERM_01133960 (macronuclear) [Tetrahymena thermophila SB210]|uniref:Kinase domain protein n=1 Tax=Tetrahymena thermophila (strain SB210) TaxID=312017 RepID=Q24HT5_TETTS|nr:hypothetical protein TTHERM_01133960 [Tetrahymena thermophila SB210]EAS07352.1 hypothetical protein TTHERM_01133960 [Tetrahymena thermophila SB210]|eukprot:XP_001027594.1 hypothetical protein TTHERM_01133960 [Tetrahymena thermophila SB210]